MVHSSTLWYDGAVVNWAWHRAVPSPSLMYAAHSDHELDSEYMRNALPQGKAVLRDLAGAWGTTNPRRTLRAAEAVQDYFWKYSKRSAEEDD